MTDSEASLEVRMRALAGRSRCATRLGERDLGKKFLDEIDTQLRHTLPEAKQAAALLKFGSHPKVPTNVEALALVAETAPGETDAVKPYAEALFWSGREEEAVNVALGLLRHRNRKDPARKLILMLIEALGPRHPCSVSKRREFNNLLFI